MKRILSLTIVVLFLSSCKKDYSCVCVNPGGSYTAFKTKSTKSKADDKCKTYYDDNFGAVPWNETACKIK